MAVVELLLQHNAIIDSKDIRGRTPLSYAAFYDHVAVVELLLKRSSNPDQKDVDGRTPFSYAVRRGHKEVGEVAKWRSKVDISEDDRNAMNQTPYFKEYLETTEGDGSKSDSERPRKRIRTRISALSE